MRDDTIYILFAILRSVFHSNQMSEADKLLVTDNSLVEVVKLASKHDIAHLIAFGVLNNGLANNEIKPQLEQIVFRTVFRYEKLNYELKQVSEVLEKAGIPFIPLKGSVLRNYYPEPWMRTSCDIDILVQKQDLRAAIDYLVNNQKYTEHEQNSHDVSLFSPSGIHIELHYDLMEDGRVGVSSEILGDVWDIVTVKEGCSSYYEMPDDMFYFYHIAHMAKHFENGGCGIRPFIDVWILDNLGDIDIVSRDSLIKKGELFVFAENSRKLSKVWLEGTPLNSILDRLQSFIIRGGVYGTTENLVAIQQQKQGGKAKYLYSRIILPYDDIKIQYPILQNHPFLLPFMQVRRWFKLAFRGRLSKGLSEISYSGKISKSQAEEMKSFLDEIGL